MSLNPFAASDLILVLTCSFLVLLILIYGKTKLHRLWACFNVAVGTWGLGSFLIGITTTESGALFSWRLTNIGIIFIAIFFFHVICTFCEISRRPIIIFAYLQGFFFLVLNVTNLFISRIKFVFGSLYYIQSTEPFYPIFFVIWISLVLWGHVELYKFYRTAQGIKRSQSLYLFFGMFAGFLGGITNFFPVFGLNLYPWRNFTISLYCIVVTYAILFHQLLDIEVIIKKTLLFSSLFVFVYAIFAFFALLGQVFFEKFITQNRWISMIPSVLVVTTMLRPLESFLITATDRYLFQKKYDYRELLKAFASDVLTVLQLDQLVNLTDIKLAEIMKLEYCKTIINDNADIHAETDLKIPISINNKAIGVLLLGKKKSDEEYTKDDIDILQSIAKTLAIAISNAQMYDELARTQAEMAQKDKMATIGTLAAGMAHEIRNPVTTIRVFSEYVPDKLNDNEFRGKYRNVVAKEVDKIDHIIQALIDFSGEEDIQQVSGVSAYEAVEELVSIISKDKDVLGRIRFINNIPSNIAKASVNKEEFDEIILNLTQNAIHAITGKGTITFNANEKSESIIIEISDTGSGMSEETIKHIFDPFFTTRSKGFGLGLFVVKELVNRNNGDIKIESLIGKGSKFRLRFKK